MADLKTKESSSYSKNPLLELSVTDLNKVHDFETLIWVVSTEGLAAGADGISLILREGDNCHYVEERSISPLWKGKRFPIAGCISGWCMLLKEPVHIPDIYRDVRVPHDAYRPTFVKSLLLVPIQQHDPIGALGAYWASAYVPAKAEVESFQELANRIAPTVERCRFGG